MMKKHDKKMVAKLLTAVTDSMLTASANSKCVFIYHQPKQPNEVKKFRRF